MIVAFTKIICSTVNGLTYVSYRSTACGIIGNAQASLCQMQNLNILE